MVGAELVFVDETAPEDSEVFGYWLGGSRAPARKAEGAVAER